jgi:hypothetical protein
MRIVILLVALLGGLVLSAQDKQTAVEKVPVSPTSPFGQTDVARCCAACRSQRKGDGPAAASFKAPRDLTRLARQRRKMPSAHVALSLEECCVHGSKVMPV